jgi:hypothetical protein
VCPPVLSASCNHHLLHLPISTITCSVDHLAVLWMDGTKGGFWGTIIPLELHLDRERQLSWYTQDVPIQRILRGPWRIPPSPWHAQISQRRWFEVRGVGLWVCTKYGMGEGKSRPTPMTAAHTLHWSILAPFTKILRTIRVVQLGSWLGSFRVTADEVF